MCTCVKVDPTFSADPEAFQVLPIDGSVDDAKLHIWAVLRFNKWTAVCNPGWVKYERDMLEHDHHWILTLRK